MGVLFYQNLPSVKFCKVQLGMSLSEVEAILGPGKKISQSQLPLLPPFARPLQKPLEDGLVPIISGDEFWFWGTDRIGWRSTIYVGFRNGKVCDKELQTDGL